MYTERIFSPYGSESTRPSTGIFKVVFSFLRNKLRMRHNMNELLVIESSNAPGSYIRLTFSCDNNARVFVVKAIFCDAHEGCFLLHQQNKLRIALQQIILSVLL